MNLKHTQANYLVAKAIYDTLRTELNTLNEPVHLAHTENKISDDQWCDQLDANAEDTGYNRARQNLLAAEKDLIAAGWDVIKTRASPFELETVRPVFESKFLRIRKQLIDLTLRLSE